MQNGNLKLVYFLHCFIQSVTNTFKIRIFKYIWSEYYLYICSYHFLDTNIFGYSFVSSFCIYEYIRIFIHIWIFPIRIFIRIFIRIKNFMWRYSDIRSCQTIQYKYIRIFVRVIFLTRIYSDIRSCKKMSNSGLLKGHLPWHFLFFVHIAGKTAEETIKIMHTPSLPHQNLGCTSLCCNNPPWQHPKPFRLAWNGRK